MKIETLNERIQKIEQKIERKKGTIQKKEKSIEKRSADLKSTNEDERRWAEVDIEWLKEDIKRLNREILESEKTLANYRAQLSGEIERQSLLTKEVPEIMKSLQDELVTEWNRYDKERKENMRKDHSEMEYMDFKRKYRGQDTSLMYKRDEEINTANIRAAEAIILNLVNRVKGITGEITDWSNLHMNPDNHGFSILNGRVRGKEGTAKVESIGAGGYNIQRYHIRVLVKAV